MFGRLVVRYVKMSRKTLSELFSMDLSSILTKTENFLWFPVFWVISSMYSAGKEFFHRSPSNFCSMMMWRTFGSTLTSIRYSICSGD